MRSSSRRSSSSDVFPLVIFRVVSCLERGDALVQHVWYSGAYVRDSNQRVAPMCTSPFVCPRAHAHGDVWCSPGIQGKGGTFFFVAVTGKT